MLLTAWRVAVQIFYVSVALIVFASLRGRTEVIVVSLFGVTYAAIRSGLIANFMLLRGVAVALNQELATIKAAVVPDFVADPDLFSQSKAAMDKLNRPFWFEYGGLSVISLICLYNLFTVLAY